MPHINILGKQVYVKSYTPMGKGGWIFWYLLFGGLSIACLWLGVSSYFVKSSTTGYDGLIFGLIGAAFFGLFWIIPLSVAIFRKLTSSTTKGSDQASPVVDQELEKLEKYKR